MNKKLPNKLTLDLSVAVLGFSGVVAAGQLGGYDPNDDHPTNDHDKKCHFVARDLMKQVAWRNQLVVDIDNNKNWLANAQATEKGAHCNFPTNKGTTRCSDLARNVANAEQALARSREDYQTASKNITFGNKSYEGCGNINDWVH
jgi:hypothetical protein